MACSFDFAKQLSLSSTTARISGNSPPFGPAKALDNGRGTWLKVDTVMWGRQRDGFTSSLTAFRVAETFIGLH